MQIMTNSEKLTQVAFDGAIYLAGALGYWFPWACKLQYVIWHAAHICGVYVTGGVG